MLSGIIISVLATFMALVAIGIYLNKASLKKRKKDKIITIKMENGSNYDIPSDIAGGDFKKLLNTLKSLENTDVKKAQKNNEAGLASNEFLVYIVPAIIAILFAVTYLYLIIAHQGETNYSVPKELTSLMTTIIGYFFGMGVANATNKGKPLSKDEINDLINKQR